MDIPRKSAAKQRLIRRIVTGVVVAGALAAAAVLHVPR